MKGLHQGPQQRLLPNVLRSWKFLLATATHFRIFMSTNVISRGWYNTIIQDKWHWIQISFWVSRRFLEAKFVTNIPQSESRLWESMKIENSLLNYNKLPMILTCTTNISITKYHYPVIFKLFFYVLFQI